MPTAKGGPVVPRKVVTRLRASFWTTIISLLISILLREPSGDIDIAFFSVASSLAVVSAWAVLIYLWRLALILNKSPIIWALGGVVIPFFGIYSYIHLMNSAEPYVKD